MSRKMKKAGAVATATDLRGSVQADGSNTPEYALDTLRAQYLAEIFALPASTALTVAELVFGSEVRA